MSDSEIFVSDLNVPLLGSVNLDEEHESLTKDESWISIEIPEVLHNILLFCDFREIGNALLTSRSFHKVATDDRLWKFIFEQTETLYKNRGFDTRYSLFGGRFYEYIMKKDPGPRFVYRVHIPEEGFYPVFRRKAMDRYRDIMSSRRKQDPWRKKVKYILHAPKFLYPITCLCPPLGLILTFLFLRYSDKEALLDYVLETPGRDYEADASGSTHFQLALLRIAPSYLIFPADPQVVDFLSLLCCSIVSPFFCCCPFSSVCAMFGVLSFEERHRNAIGKQWSGDCMPLRSISSVCSPLHVICCPFFCLLACQYGIFHLVDASVVPINDRWMTFLVCFPFSLIFAFCTDVFGKAYYFDYFCDMCFR